MALETISVKRSGNTLIVTRTDLKSLTRELKRFGRSGVDKATVRAMNSGIRSAKTAAKRSISKQRFLSAKQAEAGLKVIFATPTRQQVEIRGRGRMLPLTQLKTGVNNPKQQSLGVKVNVAQGRRTLIKGGFIARMPSGHVGVFVRKHLGGGPERVPRLPIQEQKLPSIAHTLTNDETIKAVQDRYGVVYGNTIIKQLNAAIRRANARIRR